MIKKILNISISVRNLDRMVDFYQRAAGFTEVCREKVNNDQVVNRLLGIENASYQAVILQANTTLLKLIQFDFIPRNVDRVVLPVSSPGIVHACYQSPATDPAFPKFQHENASLISRGNPPIDLAGAGITYAYMRDPEGNILEVEQLDSPSLPFPVWMGHVSLVTHDIERLSTFYNTIITGNPTTPPIFQFANHPRMDEVANLNGLEIKMSWIRDLNLELEFCQYLNPATQPSDAKRFILDDGYNMISFEVDDIQEEYQRLILLGVEFKTKPIQSQGSWAVLGYDPDGNPFQLIQFS